MTPLLTALVEAARKHLEWIDKERAGPNWNGHHRDTPGGKAIWRQWWDEQLQLCEDTEALCRAALSAYEAAKREAAEPVSNPDVLARCATAIAATFFGGSSGLDDMAQAIAEDHADACLSALRPGDRLPNGLVVCREDILRYGGDEMRGYIPHD